jgi:UDP-N-acetylglucosamine acyltransferase
MIHPTAIIDPGAELGSGVTVGPFAVIGPEVTIGDGSAVGSHAVIESRVRMGKGNRIHSFASVGAIPQDMKFRGEESWVGGVTRIGNNTLVMAYCHIAHDCIVGSRVIMANAATLAGHVTIEDGAIIGGMTGVHQFVRIGEHCIIGGMSAVSQDVPPYVTAVVSRPQRGYALYGLNLVGLRRNRFSPETVAALKAAFKIIFRAEVPLKEALARAETELPPLPQVRHLIAFVRESKRGVLR